MSLPSVSASSVSLYSNIALLHGEILTSTPEATAYGFYYVKTSSGLEPSAGSKNSYIGNLSDGPFTCYVSGLSSDEEYIFQAYAENASGVGFSTTITGSTTTKKPILSSVSATPSSTTFIATANLTSTGGSPVTAYGFCYTLSPTAYVLEDVGMSATSSYSELASACTFTLSTSNLIPETTYRYRAYAINENGTSYSKVSSFTTTKTIYGLSLYIKGGTDYYRLNCLYVPKTTDYSNMYSDEDETTSNLFNFVLTPVSGDGSSPYEPSQITYAQLFTDDPDTDFSGSEVYIRNDSPLHDYLSTYPSTSASYSSYINTKQQYLYFGKLGPRDIETNTINIETYFMKDYVYAAIPETNRVNNIREFFGVAFDQLYQPQVHQKIRNILRLSDPEETKDEYLRYLLETYGTTTIVPSGTTNYDAERFFVKNMADLFKRKGTYEALSVLYKIITKTKNKLNIYDHWHSILPSSAPYPYSSIEEYCNNYGYSFNEYNTFYSSSSLSGSTGYWSTTGARYFSDIAPSSGLISSPHYRVEMDVTTRPISNNEIFNSLLQDVIFEKFEEFRPVSRFAYYSYLLGLTSDFAGNVINSYSDIYDEFINTKCLKPVFDVNEGNYVSSNVSEIVTSFTVQHNLESKDVVIQLYKIPDYPYTYYDKFIPKNIIIVDENSIRVELSSPQRCYVFISKVSITGDESVDLYSNNAYGQYQSISFQETLGSERYETQPKSLLIDVESEPENKHVVDFSESISSSGTNYEVNLVSESVPPVDWTVLTDEIQSYTVEHNLQTLSILIDVYEVTSNGTDGGISYEKIFPHDIIIKDINHVQVYTNKAGIYRCVIRKLSDWSFFYTKEDLVGEISNVKIGYTPSTSDAYEFVVSCEPNENSLWTEITGGYTIKSLDFDKKYPDSTYSTYSLKITLNILEDININEIGLYNNNEILFYTGMSTLFVKKDTQLVLYYTLYGMTISIIE